VGEIQQFCKLQNEDQSLMRAATTQLNLSARAYHRILKLARTIADLAGSEGDPIRASGGGAAIPPEAEDGVMHRL
jgi:predicted ATPase with chaperone activity